MKKIFRSENFFKILVTFCFISFVISGICERQAKRFIKQVEEYHLRCEEFREKVNSKNSNYSNAKVLLFKETECKLFLYNKVSAFRASELNCVIKNEDLEFKNSDSKLDIYGPTGDIEVTLKPDDISKIFIYKGGDLIKEITPTEK